MREALVLLLLLAAPWPAAADDAYEQALAGARLHAENGRFAEAAQALSGPSAEWPQDFPLQLARAYYLLRAGAYQAAEAQYGAALLLEPDSPEARQGLDDARQGRGAPNQVWLGLYGGGTTYSGATSRSPLWAGVLTLDAQLADRWTLGALYRALGSTSNLTGGMRGQGGGASLSVQHEGHLVLGMSSTDWRLRLHGAAISRSAQTRAGVEQVQGYGGMAAGLSAMARFGLEWRASAVTTWYEDLTVSQLEGSATLPLGARLAFRAGVRTQHSGGTATSAALAGVEWRGPLSLTLSGEYGPQRRPVDLDGRVLYNVSEELRWAARLQASFPLSRQVQALVGADLERWRTPSVSGLPADSTVSRFSAGLVFSF